MQVFILTLTQMLMIFTFILIGIWLCKKRILPDNADLTMSRLFVYVFSSALACYTMMEYCTVEAFKNNAYLMGVGLLLNVIAILVSYPVSKLFVRNYNESAQAEYKRNIYKYCITFANYGTLGSFLIMGLGKNAGELLFKYYMFKLPMEFLCSSWGLYTLLPKDGSASMSKNILRGFLTPPMIGMMVGMVLGLLNVFPLMKQYVPFLDTAFKNASNCMGPIAMIIAGFVVGRYNFKELFSQGKVYIVSFLRLFVIPSVFLIVLKLLNASNDLLIFTLIAYAAPVGMNTIVYPAAFGGDTRTGAAMTMLSTLFSAITVPLMFMLFGIQL